MNNDSSTEPAKAQKLSVESQDEKNPVTVDQNGNQLLVAVSPVDGLRVSVAVDSDISRDELADALDLAEKEITHVRSLNGGESNDETRLDAGDAPSIRTLDKVAADGRGDVDRGDGPIADGGPEIRQLPPQYSYIQCQECLQVYPAYFGDKPTPPLRRQYCDLCDFDTEHKIVTIEEISYVGEIETDGGEVDRGDGPIADGGVSNPEARIYCDRCKAFRSHDKGDCTVCGQVIDV